jgi:hypothetical protein
MFTFFTLPLFITEAIYLYSTSINFLTNNIEAFDTMLLSSTILYAGICERGVYCFTEPSVTW